MTKLDKVIKGLEEAEIMLVQAVNRGGEMAVVQAYKCENRVRDALELLKEQKKIKSPDEFKSLLLGMFDSIWDVEIDHPVFQDTVGELMEDVLQAYRQAVKRE